MLIAITVTGRVLWARPNWINYDDRREHTKHEWSVRWTHTNWCT